MNTYMIKMSASFRRPLSDEGFFISFTCDSPDHANDGTIVRLSFGIVPNCRSGFEKIVKVIKLGFWPDLEHYLFLYQVYPWLTLLLPQRWYIEAEQIYLRKKDPSNVFRVNTFIAWF